MKKCVALKGQGENRCEIKSGGQEMVMMGNFSITTIQVNSSSKSRHQIHLNFKNTVNLLSQPFFGHHLWFHIFTLTFMAIHFFHSLAVLHRYPFFCNCIMLDDLWPTWMHGCFFFTAWSVQEATYVSRINLWHIDKHTVYILYCFTICMCNIFITVDPAIAYLAAWIIQTK